VRRTVEATNGRVALVTANAEARPRIRAMIAAEFPDVPVLATDELLDPAETLDVLMDPAGHHRGVLP
jgi:flagellar biosynthesis component FlhA